MLEITNENLLGKIVADALLNVDENRSLNTWEKLRWITAIGKGIAKLEEDATFIHWQAEEKSLLILSDSNEIYAANGVCQCRAYNEGISRRGKPFACWHRSLARIVRLYFEALEAETKPIEIDPSKMPYLKPSSNRPVERVGNVRI